MEESRDEEEEKEEDVPREQSNLEQLMQTAVRMEKSRYNWSTLKQLGPLHVPVLARSSFTN